MGLPIITALFGIAIGFAAGGPAQPRPHRPDVRAGDDGHDRTGGGHRLRPVRGHPVPPGVCRRARSPRGGRGVARHVGPGGDVRRDDGGHLAGRALRPAAAVHARPGRGGDRCGRPGHARRHHAAAGHAGLHRPRHRQDAIVPGSSRPGPRRRSAASGTAGAGPSSVIPWCTGTSALLVLLVLAVPLFSMRLAFTDAGNDPHQHHHPPGLRPVGRRASAPGSTGRWCWRPSCRRPVTAAAVTRVAQRAVDDARRRFCRRRRRSTPSGDAAVIVVFPTTSPQAAQTEALVTQLRDHVVPAATAGSGVGVLVGGETAGSVDASAYLSTACSGSSGSCWCLAFLLLMAVFRSVVVPLKAAVVNLLSVGAAYGVIVAVFQWGWLGGGHRHRGHRADRSLDPAHDVHHPLRPVDGLRGVPAVAHA